MADATSGRSGGGRGGTRQTGSPGGGNRVRGIRDGKGRVGEAAVSRIRSRITMFRAVAVIGVAGVVAVIIGTGGISPAPSVEPTVQAFLLAWENGQYSKAASMTTGAPAVVERSLSGVYRQLNAAEDSLSMGQITQRGNTATAYFHASVDLGRNGLPWKYRGWFVLHRTGSTWKVSWSPSVLVPGLREGQRLAVLTTIPGRAPVLDATGKPLALLSGVYVAGVRPGSLPHPAATADALARATKLDAGEILGQITAAPSGRFLELARLQPAVYRRMSAALGRVPGLIVRRSTIRLFRSLAPVVTGSVGTETAAVLRANGVPYQPGTTVGLSGLQQAFQRTLTGTPTTEVVIAAQDGRLVRVLRRWSGHSGAAVRTTVSSPVQRAADNALAGLPSSAAIVAVQAGTGKILAVAEHRAAGLPAVRPLAGRYHPGQAFTIISTAALLAAGFNVRTQIPCYSTNPVGGEIFSNDPEPHLGAQPPFTSDFTHACSTAFAGLSLQLDSKSLAAAANGFGIGAGWRLPLASFTGSMRQPASSAQVAADAIGAGSVRVSPLDMALAAGLVQSGSWYPPVLVTSPPDPGLKPRAPFGPQVVSTLRSLMRSTVASGAGMAANIGKSGMSAVYGQVGSAPLGSGSRLRTSWFVGFRGNVAFAVLILTESPDATAAVLAGQFARALRPDL